MSLCFSQTLSCVWCLQKKFFFKIFLLNLFFKIEKNILKRKLCSSSQMKHRRRSSPCAKDIPQNSTVKEFNQSIREEMFGLKWSAWREIIFFEDLFFSIFNLSLEPFMLPLKENFLLGNLCTEQDWGLIFHRKNKIKIK